MTRITREHIQARFGEIAAIIKRNVDSFGADGVEAVKYFTYCVQNAHSRWEDAINPLAAELVTMKRLARHVVKTAYQTRPAAKEGIKRLHDGYIAECAAERKLMGPSVTFFSFEAARAGQIRALTNIRAAQSHLLMFTPK